MVKLLNDEKIDGDEMEKNIVISLFDLTGNMVRPWAEAGYECWCFDIQHPLPGRSDGNIRFIHSDLLTAEADCPYMIENPVSTVSTYWRKPDYTFHPHQFTGLETKDNYSKKTCLWVGGGFIMPQPCRDYSLGVPDDRILKAPPGPNRANFRGATPMGFARAVFITNEGGHGQRIERESLE